MERIEVQSIDAVRDFRGQLLTFLERARLSLDECDTEVQRTRNWLQYDQLMHWRREVSRRQQQLADARSNLMGAKMFRGPEAEAEERRAVMRATRRLTAAEEALGRVKRWQKLFDSETREAVGRCRGLAIALEQEVPKAAAFLEGLLQSLEAYAESPAPVAAPRLEADADLEEA